MTTRCNVWLRWRWVACLCGALCAMPAWAAPAADLEKAVSLYREGAYQQAQDLLLTIDRDGLADEQKRQRDELVETVRIAVNQSNKAGQDLQDADQAFSAGDRGTAGKLYTALLANEYASEGQKKQAREGLALIAKQRELTRQIAASRPAESPSPPSARPMPQAVATAPAPAAPIGSREQARLTRNRAMAADAIRKGDAAVKTGRYDEALTRFQEALQLVPNHPEALNGIELVRQYRQAEGRGDLLDESVHRQLGRWVRTETLCAENEREIRRLISQNQYPQAREQLEITRRLLEAAKRDAQPPDRYSFLARQLDALGRFIDSEQAAYDQEQVGQQREVVRVKERERREAVEKERDDRIGQLMDQVMQLQRERNYRQAADVLREVLAIDPTYRNAEFLLRMVEDHEVIRNQKKNREQFMNRLQEAFLGAEDARNPPTVGFDDQFAVYPDESQWRIIANRDPFGAGPSVIGEPEQDRITRDKLATVLPAVEFQEGVGFEEVVAFLREQGKLLIEPNWRVLEAVGIDRTADVGGISLQNVTIEAALDVLLDNVAGPDAQLGFDVINGVVRLSTVDDLSRKTVTRVYDVRDMLMKIRSFSIDTEGGMSLMNNMSGMGGMGGMMGGMGGMGGMMGGMGGYGGGGYGGGYGGGGYGGGGYGGSGGEEEDEEAEEDREEMVEDFEEFIKNQIEPDTWKPDGEIGTMDIWNDRLVVTHTPRAHHELSKLLRQLRQFKDIQVMVEARFVTLRSNFLEEIGVDLDMVLNAGQAGYDQAMSAGEPVVDPRTGQLLIMPRRFGQLGYAPAAAPLAGVPLTSTTALDQPFGNVALVPSGSPNSWFERHSTPIPIQNNTLDLAGPRVTNVPGNLTDSFRQAGPAFTIFGSFLDNIQVDFLLRATQMDARGSSVDAPRLVCYNGREGFIEVDNIVSYVSSPGYAAVGGSGVGGQAARGQNPSIGQLPRGRTFSVLPTVSGDRRYVIMQVEPMVTDATLNTIPVQSGALASFFQTPDMQVSQIKTTVAVPDEGTLLLGGLRLSAEEEVEAGVPVVSKIPVLKRAFTNRSRTKDEFVLLVLVKPTIIIPDEQEKRAFEDLMTSDRTGG